MNRSLLVPALVLLLSFVGCRPASRSPAAPASSTPAAVRTLVARSGDVELHVRVVGPDSGPTLVVVHGGPGLSHDYLLDLERLADDGVRVVSYDQRGCGRSTRPTSASYTIADQVADLEAVRAAVDALRSSRSSRGSSASAHAEASS